MIINARLSRLDALGTRLDKMADPARLKAALEAGAEDVRAAASAELNDGRAPESRSGALEASLRVVEASDGYTIGTSLDYGWFLEFGTATRPATP